MKDGSAFSITRINIGLAVVGAIVFAVAAIPVTVLGKLATEAPDPATLSNYLINMRAFAVMGALFSPLLTWSALRRVPLWRALSEPALGGVIGATIGTFVGPAVGFLLLAPVGVAIASWRLARSYRERPSPTLNPPRRSR